MISHPLQISDAQLRPVVLPSLDELPVGLAGEPERADQAAVKKPEPPSDLASALRRFREDIIMRDLPGSEPGRCILREPMIDAIVHYGLDDAADFHSKITERLRAGTDGRQTRYLQRICDVVAEYAELPSV